jgi:hypothetical protein
MRAALIMLLLLPLLPARVAGAQEQPCDGNFHVVHQLDALRLNDVDFSTPDDGWAVGYDYPNETRRTSTFSHGPDERPVVVRFNESSLERTNPPHDPGTELTGVDAISPSDVWVVGTQHPNKYRTTETISYHWDGSTWTNVPVPSPGRYAWLRDVVAVTPNDIWAVGSFEKPDDGPVETLVLYYDGIRWSRVPTPSPSESAALMAIDATSSESAWAVGSWMSNRRPLVMRWNGEEWRHMKLGKRYDDGYEGFIAVDAIADDDVWMTGWTSQALHFVAGSWLARNTPDRRGTEWNNGVVATADRVWTVGYRFVPERPFTWGALRDEGSWREIDFEGDRLGVFEAIAFDGAEYVWAAGETLVSEGDSYESVDSLQRACA